MECTNCGNFYDEDFNFCPYCGNKTPQLKICPKCSFKSYEFSYCPHCGEMLLNKEQIRIKERRWKEEKTTHFLEDNNKQKLINYLLTKTNDPILKRKLIEKINNKTITSISELDKQISKDPNIKRKLTIEQERKTKERQKRLKPERERYDRLEEEIEREKKLREKREKQRQKRLEKKTKSINRFVTILNSYEANDKCLIEYEIMEGNIKTVEELQNIIKLLKYLNDNHINKKIIKKKILKKQIKTTTELDEAIKKINNINNYSRGYTNPEQDYNYRRELYG